MSLTVVQISDTHLSPDAPARISELDRCIQEVNAIEPRPDLLIHSGDVTHHGTAEEYAAAKACLDRCDVPCFLMVGNKDDRQELLNAFPAHRPLLDSEWLQYSIEDFSVRLLILDTRHALSNKGQFCTARLDHLKRMLDADPAKATVIFMHHPPFEAREVPDPFQFEDWSEVDRLGEVLSAYKSIKGIYCGHLHRSIDSTFAGLQVSSLTCLAGDLRKGSVSDEDRNSSEMKIVHYP